MFEMLVRRANDQPWEIYGRFNSEREWQQELPHVEFLRSMGPLYLKRRKVSRSFDTAHEEGTRFERAIGDRSELG